VENPIRPRQTQHSTAVGLMTQLATRTQSGFLAAFFLVVLCGGLVRHSSPVHSMLTVVCLSVHSRPLFVRTCVTRWLHFTACCTTGCVNYANKRSQAALERSSQDADDVIRLTRAARRPCKRCGAFDRIFKKEFVFIFLFYFYPRYHMISRDDKN